MRGSHDLLTNGDPTPSTCLRDDAESMTSPGSNGVVMSRSLDNRMYPIVVCLRSLVFRRVLERYIYVLMGIPEMCTLRYAHCKALLPPRRKCTSAKQFADEGSFADDTLTDSSKKDVPTKRGVISAVADEDPTREGRCGGDTDAAVEQRCHSASIAALMPMSVWRAS